MQFNIKMPNCMRNCGVALDNVSEKGTVPPRLFVHECHEHKYDQNIGKQSGIATPLAIQYVVKTFIWL